MPRLRQRSQSLSTLSEINLTPLIDLAFSLLIIFIISAPLLQSSLTVDLPETTHTPPPAEPSVHKLVLNKQGNISLDDTPLTSENLASHLAQLPKSDTIHLQADKSLPFQKIITLLDTLNQHQLTKVALDTQTR